MARTREEISTMLAAKFKAESNRLKSWGTKTDDKASVSFAMSVVDFVIALMCESRHRELKRLLKKCPEMDSSKYFARSSSKYLRERLKATKHMAKALENFAVANETKRVWKHKSEHKHKHKHEHRRHK